MASDAFKDAQVRVNQLSERPSNDDLLKLYALFKQATVGDVDSERPGGFDFKGNAKWDAWKKIQGTTSGEAESQYITLVNQLEG